MNLANRNVVTLKTLPVCQCGYVFTKLSYSPKAKEFTPAFCPNCKSRIESIDIKKDFKLKNEEFNLTELQPSNNFLASRHVVVEIC